MTALTKTVATYETQLATAHEKGESDRYRGISRAYREQLITVLDDATQTERWELVEDFIDAYHPDTADEFPHVTTTLQNVKSRYLIRTRLSDGIDSVPVPALTFFSSILDQLEGDGYDFVREALHPYGWGIGHPDHSVADDIHQYASSSLPLVNAILEHAFYADQHSAVELLEELVNDESVKELIDPEIDAIVPVHYAGQAVDVDVFRDLAEDHGLKLLEDAAQGLGGQFKGTVQGTIGDVGCHSFHPTKSITTAEGGILVTDDEDVAQTARQLRLAGVDKDAWDRDQTDEPSWYYDVKSVSSKFNMTDVHAAIGLAQFEKLLSFLERRRTVAAILDEKVSSISGVRPLVVRSSKEHARHLYTIVLDTDELGTNRREFENAVNAEGIDTGIYYIPIYHHTAFEDIQHAELSTTESISDRILCLPLHPALHESDATNITRAVEKVVTHLKG